MLIYLCSFVGCSTCCVRQVQKTKMHIFQPALVHAAIFCALLAASTAQFPPTNLPSSCAATLCVQGTICVETRSPITGQVQARCIDQPEKSGSCPPQQPDFVGICSSNCGGDLDCEGIQKCCRNPCGADTCQNPVQQPQRPSCATVRCGPGQVCVLKQVQCVRAPCFPQPTCVNVIVRKPGVCPRRSLTQGLSSTRCRVDCNSDGECPGNTKCCQGLFCGRTCQQPRGTQQTRITCANVRCRPGFVCQDRQVQCLRQPCPTRPVCTGRVLVTPVKQCPQYFRNTYCARRDQCSPNSGYGCPRGSLCCPTPCGRRCV